MGDDAASDPGSSDEARGDSERVEQFFEPLAYDLDLRCNRLSKTEVLVPEQPAAGVGCGAPDDGADRERGPQARMGRAGEIRLLGNLETGAVNCCRLCSQVSRAGRKLERPEYRQLKQRIALRCALRGLDLEEATAYINSRTARAGRPSFRVTSSLSCTFARGVSRV